MINHLQDCGQDFARLDRVYLPADALASAGAASPTRRRARRRPCAP